VQPPGTFERLPVFICTLEQSINQYQKLSFLVFRRTPPVFLSEYAWYAFKTKFREHLKSGFSSPMDGAMQGTLIFMLLKPVFHLYVSTYDIMLLQGVIVKQIRVGTRELKNNLSRYLRRVKAGEPITITERGKPIGQIIPIQDDLIQRLKNLSDAGLVEWIPTPPHSYQPQAINEGKKSLSDLIIEDRE
jgi:prevent-host-death family protein